jgi:Uncharacterized conserved protein (DUF2075)
MSEDTDPDGYCGWRSTFPVFVAAPASAIVDRLRSFVRDVSPEQYAAWQRYVPALQMECREAEDRDTRAATYSAILEYQLPYDLRRPDLIILEGAAVVVTEMKGHRGLSQASLDQVLAYVRDLRAYHEACADRPVFPVLLTSSAPHPPIVRAGVRICHPDDFDQVISEIGEANPGNAVRPQDFVAPGAYVPLPTIVQAARQLFETRELPFIKRARAATEPALEHITGIAHQAAKDRTRHLVLLSGVPGSGKTLVGLQLVHSRWLDDLAVPRPKGKPTVAGVYLSGNGPLIRVLQDALKDAGGGGQTFVRPVKSYVDYYANRPTLVPPEHLLVYDEAQRAHDADQVAYVHRSDVGLSEPAHLLEFCMRVPEWNVVVALIGTGQAIHVGEEVGLPLWREAVDTLPSRTGWTVHCAPATAEGFRGGAFRLAVSPHLSLDKELRFHLTADIDRFVNGLLESDDPSSLRTIADNLRRDGHRFLITREFAAAKSYVRDRYEGSPLARYGLLASSKDKILPRFGIDNTYQTTKRLREGPWYNSDPTSPESCCRLDTVATEFASQGLELDFAVLAWGSDLRRRDGTWTDDHSGGYRRPVKNRLALRKNVYRVLLTRGRDGTAVYVPEVKELDELYQRLTGAGFQMLE